MQTTTITKLETITGFEGVSTGHWARGVLQSPIEVGKPIILLREANSIHPEGCLGVFMSTAIKKIDGEKIYTQNSLYRIS